MTKRANKVAFVRTRPCSSIVKSFRKMSQSSWSADSLEGISSKPPQTKVARTSIGTPRLDEHGNFAELPILGFMRSHHNSRTFSSKLFDDLIDKCHPPLSSCALGSSRSANSGLQARSLANPRRRRILAENPSTGRCAWASNLTLK